MRAMNLGSDSKRASCRSCSFAERLEGLLGAGDGFPVTTLNSSSRKSAEVRHGYLALKRRALSFMLYALDFMKGVCFKVAFSTVGTGHKRDVLDDQCALPFTVGS